MPSKEKIIDVSALPKCLPCYISPKCDEFMPTLHHKGVFVYITTETNSSDVALLPDCSCNIVRIVQNFRLSLRIMCDFIRFTHRTWLGTRMFRDISTVRGMFGQSNYPHWVHFSQPHAGALPGSYTRGVGIAILHMSLCRSAALS